MGRIVLSVLLGLLSPIVFLIAAEPFEGRGQAFAKAILAGCIALALYLAVCQFLVARRGARGFRAMWPALVAMNLPVLAAVLIIAAVERRDVVLSQGIPMLLSGLVGSLAGAAVAARRTDAERAPNTSR